MTPREFQLFVDRDGGRCMHCGTDWGLVPQHRLGRGMGGSKERERPSNVITFCGKFNGLIESDPQLADIARAYGWKLRAGDEPLMAAVFDYAAQSWFFLDDDYHRTKVDAS